MCVLVQYSNCVMDIDMYYNLLRPRLTFTLFWMANRSTHFPIRPNPLIATVGKLHDRRIFCAPAIPGVINRKLFLNIIIIMTRQI